MLIWVIGMMVLAADLFYVFVHLSKLNVISYLLSIGIFPAVVLLATSFLFSIFSAKTKKNKYFFAVAVAFVFAVLTLIFCSLVLNDAVIAQMISNSMFSEDVEVSVRLGNTGDTVQSFLLYIAFAGIGCFFGNVLRTKHNHKTGIASAEAIQLENEYD